MDIKNWPLRLPVASEIIYTSEFSSRALSTYVPGNTYKFRFRITLGQPGRKFCGHTHWLSRLVRQKFFPEIWKLSQASQAEFCVPTSFVGTQNSLTAVIGNHIKLDILQMCWVWSLKVVCTLSGGPILHALQVSLNFENCKHGFWIWTGFQAWRFILYLILYNPWFRPIPLQ